MNIVQSRLIISDLYIGKLFQQVLHAQIKSNLANEDIGEPAAQRQILFSKGQEAVKVKYFLFFSIWLDVPHLTNEHRTQDCIAS